MNTAGKIRADAQGKLGKLLEPNIRSGNLFSGVTRPPAEDETMIIRTSAMMVGIRGACGRV